MSASCDIHYRGSLRLACTSLEGGFVTTITTIHFGFLICDSLEFLYANDPNVFFFFLPCHDMVCLLIRATLFLFLCSFVLFAACHD